MNTITRIDTTIWSFHVLMIYKNILNTNVVNFACCNNYIYIHLKPDNENESNINYKDNKHFIK